MNRKKLILCLTMLVIFFHLTWSVNFTNVAIGLLVLSILLDKRIGIKIRKLISTSQFWILISPFIVFSLSALYSSDGLRAWKEIEIKLPLLVFPFIYGLAPMSEKYRDLVFKFFILITILIPVIGFISQLGTYFETKDSGYFYNDHLVHYAGKKQAAYFGLYANFALVGVFYFWQKISVKTKLQKITLASAFSFLLIIQYLLASRMALLIMFLVIIGFLIVQIFTNTSRKQILSMLIGAALVSIGLIVLFPKVIKRFNSITHTDYQFDNTNPINHFNGEIKAENWNGLNTRLALWTCAWEQIKEKPFFGTGIGDVQNDLVKKYQEKNFIFALESNFNSHNQYLDIMLSNGIVGLFLFVCFILYILYLAIKNKSWFLAGVVVIVAMSCLTENILSRNQGVVVFIVFLSMLLFSEKETIKKI